MGMKKLFVIGGMGAGKSTARKVLAEQGVPYIDLDKVGHDVLLWDTVKADLVEALGAHIRGGEGLRHAGGDAQAQPHHHAAHRGGVHRSARRA